MPEEISPEYREFMRSAGIQHFQVHINANKGGVRVQSCDMSRALNVVLDRSNHPILIHCNKGKVSSAFPRNFNWQATNGNSAPHRMCRRPVEENTG